MADKSSKTAYFAIMSGDFIPQNWQDLSKPEKYKQVQSQILGILDKTVTETANLANAAALLKEAFGWWWVGFYQKQNESLILGPFQGPVACTKIAYGKGVCGSTWKEEKTLIVPNVDEFPGHIACSAASKSEIVVPIYKSNGKFWGVLDADSEHLSHFDELDGAELEIFCRTLASILS
jgi:GAF domain-containing protein